MPSLIPNKSLWVPFASVCIFSPLESARFTPLCACKKKIDLIYEDEELWDMRNEFGETRVSKYISVIYMALNKSNFTLGESTYPIRWQIQPNVANQPWKSLVHSIELREWFNCAATEAEVDEVLAVSHESSRHFLFVCRWATRPFPSTIPSSDSLSALWSELLVVKPV